MKTIIAFLFLVFIAYSLHAQEPCNDESIMSVKGKWTKRPDANMKAGNLSEVIIRIDKMQKLLQSAYPDPKGIEVYWYRSMGGYYSSQVKSSESYELNALFKAYYCNTNFRKQMLSIEASTSFDVWANKLKWFAQVDENFLIENRPVYLLTKKLGELKGFTLFAGSDNGSANTGVKFSRTILISRAGQLPYTPVTRKQYLVTFLKNKEAWQKKYEEKLRQEDINRSKAVYQRDIKAAQDYMNNTSAEELAKPAYVSTTSYAGTFLKFAKENEGMMMVQENERYFNNKLLSHIPQYLVVYWRWNAEKPALDFADQIEKNFNFKALQEMLDK